MKAAYKPDGPYGVFAGNECTVAFAKMDMSGAFLNENGHVALTEAEQKSLQEWMTFFLNKYPVIGKLGNKKD